MYGKHIIAFAKDWGHDPTSCNHVLSRLAEDNTVLWLNSISARSPNLKRMGDGRRALKKIASWLRPATEVQPGLWVYTPPVFPFHDSTVWVAVNKLLLSLSVGLVARKLQMERPQIWTWVPTSAPYVDVWKRSRLVYYCTDDWSQFNGVNSGRIDTCVETLATRADVVFATSKRILDKVSQFNANAFLANHGVDHALFSSALDTGVVPEELKGIEGPILGYYGLVDDWIDQSLLESIANRHPEWTIVIVGEVRVDVGGLSGLPNVRFIDRKPHRELPNYCRRFSVGLIPHRVTRLTESMNPIKLREYLAAGLPVVSTNLPEVHRYDDICSVAETFEEFESMVGTSISQDSASARRLRSDRMKDETWEGVVQMIKRTVDNPSEAVRAPQVSPQIPVSVSL